MRIAEVAHQQGFDGFFKISGFARMHGFNHDQAKRLGPIDRKSHCTI